MCRKLILISFVLLCLAANARAQTELQQDIGNPALAGSATFDAATGTWTVVGGGEDVWGTSDQLYYVFRPLAGDGDLSVHYISMDLTHEYAKVGVMIRDTLDADSKHVLISQTGSHGIQTVWRDATGGGSTAETTSGGGMNWLKIERAGDTITTSYSPVGAMLWIPHQTLNVPMSATATVGIFVNSHVGDTLCTAVFDNVVFNVPPATAAWNLSPADGSMILDAADVILSWMPGDTATSHNVHLGTTSPPELLLNQIETSYVPEGLEGGVTYYWRIDEVEADSRVVEGVEMSFTTYREGTGTILREVWEGIGGTVVSDLTNNANYPANPSWSDELTTMNVTGFADNFGSRLHGWLLPETSGDYTFWIASDDSSQLWLSTSDSPADAKMLCEEPGCCNDYDGRPEQKSAPVYLEGGQKYYISAMYKEGGGGDWCKVAWEGPDSPTRTDIDGYYLMPFENLWAWAPSPADGATGADALATLSWLPAVDAVSYDVYLGDTLLGNTAETSIEVGPLMLEGSYAWRVDAVTETEVRPGHVWTFTVKNNIVLDNFESYDIVPEKVADQSVVADAETIVAAAPDDARLLVLYSFENNANDTSGNARDCGAQAGESGYPTFEEGIDGQAIRFNGDGDHVVDPDAGDYLNGLSELTISMWVKSDVVDTDKGFLMGDDYSWSDRRGMRYDVLGGSCNRCPNVIKYGVASTGDVREEDESSSYVQTTEWQHVLMTWQSEVGLKLYVDGVLDEPGDDSSAQGGVTEGYTTLMIGKGSKDNKDDESWDGLIDEVRIYSYALSYAEARSLAGKTEDLVIQEAYGPMIAEYNFDADASDSSGNNLNGILIGDANTATGLLQLDGDGDCVDLGHHAVLNPETGQFSISAWFNISDWGPNWGNIIVSKRGENGRGWQLRRRGSSHHYCFTVRGSSGGDDPEGTIEPTLNEWHHIAAIYDPVGGKRTVYIDGQLDKQINDTGRCRGSGHNAYIGGRATRNNDGQEGFFNGMIDDVKLYQIALTAPEVLELAEIVATTVISDTWAGSAAADMSSHWGARSMTVEYAGEVVRSMPVADMTTGGAAALSLWVSGNPDNVTDKMSLTITDADGQSSTIPYDSDAIDLTSTDWQEWNIDLRVLGAADVSNVDSISLNIAGSGVVSVDDIRLYNCRCMPSVGKPAADLNDDCVVDFEDLDIVVSSLGTSIWGAVTEDWAGVDVGNPLAGSDEYDPNTGTFTITGNGNDIWGNSDNFHYVYRQLTGDGEVIARVTDNGTGTNDWTKGGVMIRQSLDGGSTHADTFITSGSGNGYTFQRRLVAGGGSSSNNGVAPAIAPPYWVKVERTGNDFSGYISPDGITWNQHGVTVTIEMTDPVLIGLAVTSHVDGTLRTFTFDNVTINLLPADLSADLNGNGVVDFGDLGLVLEQWGDEQLWPEL